MAKNEIKKHDKKNPGVKKAPAQEKVTNAYVNFSKWIAIGIFVITTTMFFWEQLTGSGFFWEDFVEQVYPIQTFAAKSFSDGQIPFWNPYSFCGMPFYADLQVGFLYPLNRLTALFIDSSGHLSVWGMQFLIILHFLFAQICMYFLMKYLKVSSIGSIIASISYAFSFAMVLHVIHPMMVYHLAWFPLILMFFIKGISEYKIKYGIIAGLIFGFSMLAGHPQTILYEALFLGLLLIWNIVGEMRKGELKGKKITKFIITGFAPFIISVCIFSVQFLPSQDLANLSKRATSTYESASEGSLAFKQIYTSIVPKFYGFIDGAGDKSVPFHLDKAPYYYYWDTAFYFGITALLLGLIGIVFGYKNRLQAFLIFISLFGFFFALGDNFFLFKIFYNLPFFGLLRIPARIMFYVVLAFSILTGLGFDYLWQSVKDKSSTRKILIAMSIPFLIAILTVTGTLSGLLETPEKLIDAVQGFGISSLVFVISILVISILMGKGILKPIAAGTILIVLTFTDLYIQGESFNNNPKNPEDTYKLNPELKNLFVSKGNYDLFRVSTRLYNPSYTAMTRNQGMIDKIMMVEGYNQLVLEHIPPPCDFKTIYNLYNVKYKLNFNNNTGQVSFIPSQNYLPRAWFVYNATISSPENIKRLMETNKSIDYTKSVVLEKNTSIKFPVEQSNIKYKVKFTEYSNNKIGCKVETSENGILVFSEIWYPDWQPYIDGKSVELLKADYSFRAVSVPKGRHTVEMKYESSKFNTGFWLSSIALALSIIGIFILRKE